jgi:hypothetical protein
VASKAETPVTPRFNLSYQAGAAQVYATAAMGIASVAPIRRFRRLAPGIATLGLTAVLSTYKSDSLWSYELGAKGKLLAAS